MKELIKKINAEFETFLTEADPAKFAGIFY